MIRESTKELAKRAHEITIEEWNNTPLNTYERQYLFEFISNDLFIAICKVYNNYTEQVKVPTTYNETVLTLLFPELIKRFETSQEAINKTIEQVQLGTVSDMNQSIYKLL